MGARADCVPTGLLTLALPNRDFPVLAGAAVINSSPCPAFSYLYRSFGSTESNLTKLTNLVVASAKRRHTNVSMVVYLDCGPCRPPRRPFGQFSLIAPSYTIQGLNRAIEASKKPVIQAYFQAYRHVALTLPKASNLHYKITLCLEDNYSKKTYQVLDKLARKAFAGVPRVEFGRNSVISNFSTGYIESHGYGSKTALYGSRLKVSTGDGYPLCFPSEVNCRGSGMGDIKAWMSQNKRNGILSLIYRPDIQGVDGSSKGVFKRSYKLSHQSELINILKGD